MATIKISDLSVGDWVKYEDKNYRLYAIEECGFLRGKWRNGDNIAHIAKNIAYFDPIPITPEILEANGIHRTYEDDNYAIFRGDSLWAVKYSDGVWELSTPPVCRVDIKYVHQLQHALRLAGVEKEIVMPKK